MLTVSLHFPVDGADRLLLRPLTGADERAAPRAADALLARLAQPGPGLVAGEAVARLTVGDRDRAFAALHADLYGPAVIADTDCAGCGTGYEIRFDLDALVRARQPDGRATGAPPTVAVGGARYRLPRIADLHGDAADLRARLRLDAGGASVEAQASDPPDAEIDDALEAADPALALDLSGRCPACGLDQRTPFAMVGFLSAALARDARLLLREVHLIATTYGWALDAILSLTRAERHGFVALILAERDARAAARPAPRPLAGSAAS